MLQGQQSPHQRPSLLSGIRPLSLKTTPSFQARFQILEIDSKILFNCPSRQQCHSIWTWRVSETGIAYSSRVPGFTLQVFKWGPCCSSFLVFCVVFFVLFVFFLCLESNVDCSVPAFSIFDCPFGFPQRLFLMPSLYKLSFHN